MPGKIEASLNEKLSNVEWGTFKYDKFFSVIKISNKLTRSDLNADGTTPVFSSESGNNGIAGYTNKKPDFSITEEVPIYILFGEHTRSFNFATRSFCAMDNVKVLQPKKHYSLRTLMYIVTAWRRSIADKGYARHWSIAKDTVLWLPITKDKEVDFTFIENFVAELEAQRVAELEAQRVAELEAYLSVSRLKNYELTDNEQRALEDFSNYKITFESFAFKDIFNNIKQGRRLKKEDQIAGEMPFVMAGVTNAGVVNYVSNPVATFPENSITIDIFGNTFYRNFSFGAGDDTGVYWNTAENYSEETMLYFATAMEKSLTGKFTYGKKLRSSQSFNFKMSLPIIDGKPNHTFMSNLISAIKKLVIKEVVLYADKKISATRNIITK